jgi:hypothetical protein
MNFAVKKVQKQKMKKIMRKRRQQCADHFWLAVKWCSMYLERYCYFLSSILQEHETVIKSFLNYKTTQSICLKKILLWIWSLDSSGMYCHVVKSMFQRCVLPPSSGRWVSRTRKRIAGYIGVQVNWANQWGKVDNRGGSGPMADRGQSIVEQERYSVRMR